MATKSTTKAGGSTLRESDPFSFETAVQVAGRMVKRHGDQVSPQALGKACGRGLVLSEADRDAVVAEARKRSPTLDHAEIVAKRIWPKEQASA